MLINNYLKSNRHNTKQVIIQGTANRDNMGTAFIVLKDGRAVHGDTDGEFSCVKNYQNRVVKTVCKGVIVRICISCEASEDHELILKYIRTLLLNSKKI